MLEWKRHTDLTFLSNSLLVDQSLPNVHDFHILVTLSDPRTLYIPGSFCSGTLLYSTHHYTFLLPCFFTQGDSLLPIRYLDLHAPLSAPPVRLFNGKNGAGIAPEDAEALAHYAWSAEQVLWSTLTGRGGYNYAGAAHASYWNRRFQAPSVAGKNA